MELSTDNQKKGLRQILRALGERPVPKHKVFKVLVDPEEGAYEVRGDAKKFLKNVVDAEEFPVKSNGNLLFRTDMNDFSEQQSIEEVV